MCRKNPQCSVLLTSNYAQNKKETKPFNNRSEEHEIPWKKGQKYVKNRRNLEKLIFLLICSLPRKTFWIKNYCSWNFSKRWSLRKNPCSGHCLLDPLEGRRNLSVKNGRRGKSWKGCCLKGKGSYEWEGREWEWMREPIGMMREAGTWAEQRTITKQWAWASKFFHRGDRSKVLQ